MRALVALAFILVSVSGTRTPVPQGAAELILDAGVVRLEEIIEQLNTSLIAAVDAFKPINTTCMTSLDQAVTSCSNCVQQKCTSRGNDVCEPNDFEKFVGKTAEFLEKSTKFILKKVPNEIVKFHKKIGKQVIGVGRSTVNEIGRVGERVGKEVGRVGESVGKEVGRVGERVGKEVGRVAESAVKEVGRVGERVGKEVGRVGERVGKEIGRVGSCAGKEVRRVFRRIFGRRKRSLVLSNNVRVKRSEPSCDDFENDVDGLCDTYLQSSYCPACGFDPMTSCPGYSAARQTVIEAEDAMDWLYSRTTNTFSITQMTFMIGATGQFEDVRAQVNLFGKDLSLNLGSVNPYLPQVTGTVLADQAVEKFKQSITV